MLSMFHSHYVNRANHVVHARKNPKPKARKDRRHPVVKPDPAKILASLQASFVEAARLAEVTGLPQYIARAEEAHARLMEYVK